MIELLLYFNSLLSKLKLLVSYTIADLDLFVLEVTFSFIRGDKFEMIKQ